MNADPRGYEPDNPRRAEGQPQQAADGSHGEPRTRGNRVRPCGAELIEAAMNACYGAEQLIDLLAAICNLCELYLDEPAWNASTLEPVVVGALRFAQEVVVGSDI
jgi:hypothetical protein